MKRESLIFEAIFTQHVFFKTTAARGFNFVVAKPPTMLVFHCVPRSIYDVTRIYLNQYESSTYFLVVPVGTFFAP